MAGVIALADVWLPDRAFAIEQGWTHQVNWRDPGGPICFMRYADKDMALRAIDDLEAANVNGRKILLTDLRAALGIGTPH